MYCMLYSSYSRVGTAFVVRNGGVETSCSGSQPAPLFAREWEESAGAKISVLADFPECSQALVLLRIDIILYYVVAKKY